VGERLLVFEPVGGQGALGAGADVRDVGRRRAYRAAGRRGGPSSPDAARSGTRSSPTALRLARARPRGSARTASPRRRSRSASPHRRAATASRSARRARSRTRAPQARRTSTSARSRSSSCPLPSGRRSAACGWGAARRRGSAARPSVRVGERERDPRRRPALRPDQRQHVGPSSVPIGGHALARRGERLLSRRARPWIERLLRRVTVGAARPVRAPGIAHRHQRDGDGRCACSSIEAAAAAT